MDVAIVINRAVHTPGGLFSKEIGPSGRFVNAVFIMVPIVGLLGVPLAFRLYRDRSLSMESQGGDWGYDAGGAPDNVHGGFVGEGARQRQSTNFAQFQGQGQRLGSD